MVTEKIAKRVIIYLETEYQMFFSLEEKYSRKTGSSYHMIELLKTKESVFLNALFATIMTIKGITISPPLNTPTLVP